MRKNMETEVLKFTFKGSFIMLIGVYLSNLLIVNLLDMIGLDRKLNIILVNTFISGLVVAYVVTFIESKSKDKSKFISRYVKFGILFGLTAYLWVNGTYF